MKTNQIMHRPFLYFHVRQYHKTGFLNCNDALKAVNATRLEKGLSEKELKMFFRQNHSEYLEALCKYLNTEQEKQGNSLPCLKPANLIMTKEGRADGTWLHPYYHTKFARWLSPEFEAMVDIWVTDHLLFYRDASGNAYKELNKALDVKFNIGEKKWKYVKVAQFVSRRVLGSEESGQWNYANEKQLHARDNLMRRIMTAAEFGQFESVDDLLEKI